MTTLHPLKLLRPPAEHAAAISSPPYDVLNRKEATELASGNPLSFLRISRSELELDVTVDPYSEEVYSRAKENLERFCAQGFLQEDKEESLYLYELSSSSQRQCGVVGGCLLEEYASNIIKRHEKTRLDKENDRTRHILSVEAQTGLAFLAYRELPEIQSLVFKEKKAPSLFSFTANDGIKHEVWKVADNASLVQAFSHVPALYIADGHHRVQAAWRTREQLRAAHPEAIGTEPYNYLLAAIFPHTQLRILPYNRIIRSLRGKRREEVLAEVAARYTVKRSREATPQCAGDVCLYLDSSWYYLSPRFSHFASQGVLDRLQVMLLQRHLLEPIFGIVDQRTDKNIDFIGGIRGTKELERLVDSGEAACAFSLYPTTMDELMEVSDQNLIMTPKSTWFEPKLRSGLFINKII